MATMVGIGAIAVRLGGVPQGPGDDIMPGIERVATKCPSRTEPEDGQHQPQREESFGHAHATMQSKAGVDGCLPH